MTSNKVQTRQEAIREGIAERIYKEAPGWKCGYLYIPFKEADSIVREQYLRKAEDWLKHLDSQGLVIKVERELPDNKMWHKKEREFEAYCAGRNDMLNAGYGAFEPLIEVI